MTQLIYVPVRQKKMFLIKPRHAISYKMHSDIRDVKM